MTVNNKCLPKPTTKWKLAYEIAKFVYFYEEIIKVNVIFPFIGSFLNVHLSRPVQVAPT